MLQMCLTCDAARSSTIIGLSSGAAHLKGVIGGQADGEAASKEGGEGVAVVVQEEGVVGEGGHAQANLGQVVEVLQGWGLAQIDAVGDVVAEEHGGHQVVHIPSLTCSQHDIGLPCLVFALSGARLKRCLLCLVSAWSGAVLGSQVVFRVGKVVPDIVAFLLYWQSTLQHPKNSCDVLMGTQTIDSPADQETGRSFRKGEAAPLLPCSLKTRWDGAN